MTKIATHYDNLKVARDAPDIVIRAAYKSLVQKYHPDKNPGDANAGRIMAIINRSYEVLSDPEQRRSHDFWIRHEELKLRQRESVRPSESASASQAPPPTAPPSPSPAPSPASARSERGHGSQLGIVRAKAFRFLLATPFHWLASRLPAPLFALLLMGVGMALLGVVTGKFSSHAPDHAAPSSGPALVSATPGPVSESEKASFTKSAPPEPPSYSRPATAPNGVAWPGRVGYVKGYPVRNTHGYSNVEVDNTLGGTDVFAKLVSVDAGKTTVVRQFYLPAGSRFTMKTVAPGKYDLRYRDLDTGGLSRSESFDVEERRTGNRLRFSNLTMTLYKVSDGNFHTYGLSEDEF